MKTDPTPKIVAPLDAAFLPAVLFNRRYADSVKTAANAVPLVIGLERENGLRSRFETMVKPDAGTDTLRYVERLVKFLLWARGGWRIWIGGPRAIGEHIAQVYSRTGARNFDVSMMSRAYERPVEVTVSDVDAVPAENEMSASLGGHLDGCRIGFDLGASDYKVAAVKDGEAVFSDEFPWNPKDEPDPNLSLPSFAFRLEKGRRAFAARGRHRRQFGGHHREQPNHGGVAVPGRAGGKFSGGAKIFLRIRDEWNVPVAVANDGDVTALAGAMSLRQNGMLGIAMGSSEAAGYLNPRGGMTGWLSELAFAPVDYNPAAAADEWSGDRGVGVSYFSQQAVNKLLPAAKIDLPAGLGLPERLKEVQSLMAKGDSRAAKIYETIGVYLGYSHSALRGFL